MSLPHIWAGCTAYNLGPLRDALLAHLPTLCPSNSQTLDFDKWPSPFWFPLFMLKPLEKRLAVSKPQAALLRNSRATRENAIGSYLWYIWKQHMKETAVPSFLFAPRGHVTQLALAIGVG